MTDGTTRRCPCSLWEYLETLFSVSSAPFLMHDRAYRLTSRKMRYFSSIGTVPLTGNTGIAEKFLKNSQNMLALSRAFLSNRSLFVRDSSLALTLRIC